MALGPGMGTTGIFVPHAKRDQAVAGSETSGMPASLTRAIWRLARVDQQLRRTRHFVMFVIADQRFRNVVVFSSFGYGECLRKR